MSAWKIFQEKYFNADLSRFTQKDWFGDSSNSVFFKSKDGEEMVEVFGNFTKEMKKELGLITDFPPELSLNTNPKLPSPALGAADKP